MVEVIVDLGGASGALHVGTPARPAAREALSDEHAPAGRGLLGLNAWARYHRAQGVDRLYLYRA